MKKKLFVPLPFLLCLAFNVFSQQQVEVPLSLVSGYSVFHPGVGGITVEPEDSPFRLEVKGIPKNLKNITRHQFRIDEKQFFYQFYKSKKISKELYDQWMSFIKYVPNEKELSKTPLRVSVCIIVGENEAGNKIWLADTDTDLDFSDEQARPLLMYAMPLDFEKYQSFTDNAVQVKHQRLRDGKVVEEVFPLAVVGMPDDAQVYFNFPRHYSATINVNDEVHQVAIESGSFVSLSLDEANNALVVLTDEVKNKTVGLTVPVRPNQYFYLGNEVYQYLGVDKSKTVAKIKKVQDVGKVQSAQIGFTTPDFKGKDFQTGKEVAMEHLRGKYVLLDFWATWCGPCIAEFPRLKDLISQYDKSRFEVIGIIGHSTPEDVAKLIDKYGLTWTQLVSDEIVAQHGVNSYPASLLISPEGKVIYKNIKGEELEKVLAELLK